MYKTTWYIKIDGKDEVRLAQQKISQLTTEYNKFSKVAGLNTYKNRMSVSGYHKVATKQ